MTALAVGLNAQAPAAPAAAQKSQKNWKNTAEYDLYSAIIKPTATPAERLQNLDKWKAGYPQSDYADTRQKIYLITYAALNNHRAAFDTAIEILKTDPNDFESIKEILGYVRALEPTDAKATLSAQNKADLDMAEKVARYLIANGDAVFAADRQKLAGATDIQWAQAKSTMEKFAQFTLGYIGVEEKDTAKAEAELIKDLQVDPTNASASLMLANLLLTQQKEHPDKMPLALFEYARASNYDGTGALDAKTRASLDNFLTTKAYPTYHGSAQGLPELKVLAKTNALPPGDMSIKSTVDLAKEDEAKREKAAADNPMLAFWTEIKEALTSSDAATSDKYWDAMKGAGLPPAEKVPTGKFKGTLISATPETRPKELLIAIEKPDVADAKLVLEEPLPGKMEPGGEISFFGAAEELSKSPFMITFKVSKDDIEGWTGKGPAGARSPGAGKKAPAKKKE